VSGAKKKKKEKNEEHEAERERERERERQRERETEREREHERVYGRMISSLFLINEGLVNSDNRDNHYLQH